MNFKIGDHIVTTRTFYTHHGIYVGEGRVIHHSGFSKPFEKGMIEETTIEAFKDKSNVYVYPEDLEKLVKGKKYSPSKIVARANEALHNQECYHLLFNNCEHFANWCTHDDAYSSQASGTVERNVRYGNYYQAGGLTLLDAIEPFKFFLKKKK